MTEAQLLSAETRNLRSKKSLVAPAIKKAGFIPVFLMAWTDEPLEEILRIMSRINPIVYTFSKDNSVSISELE